jgi:hypothetical protein
MDGELELSAHDAKLARELLEILQAKGPVSIQKKYIPVIRKALQELLGPVSGADQLGDLPGFADLEACMNRMRDGTKTKRLLNLL